MNNANFEKELREQYQELGKLLDKEQIITEESQKQIMQNQLRKSLFGVMNKRQRYAVLLIYIGIIELPTLLSIFCLGWEEVIFHMGPLIPFLIFLPGFPVGIYWWFTEKMRLPHSKIFVLFLVLTILAWIGILYLCFIAHRSLHELFIFILINGISASVLFIETIKENGNK